jgi:hypothetical protein
MGMLPALFAFTLFQTGSQSYSALSDQTFDIVERLGFAVDRKTTAVTIDGFTPYLVVITSPGKDARVTGLRLDLVYSLDRVAPGSLIKTQVKTGEERGVLLKSRINRTLVFQQFIKLGAPQSQAELREDFVRFGALVRETLAKLKPYHPRLVKERWYQGKMPPETTTFEILDGYELETLAQGWGWKRSAAFGVDHADTRVVEGTNVALSFYNGNETQPGLTVSVLLADKTRYLGNLKRMATIRDLQVTDNPSRPEVFRFIPFGQPMTVAGLKQAILSIVAASKELEE